MRCRPWVASIGEPEAWKACARVITDRAVPGDVRGQLEMAEQARPLPPLPVAAARGDIDALTTLLADGIDINATTRTQPRSALMEACKGNSDAAVDFLIARGCADPLTHPLALFKNRAVVNIPKTCLKALADSADTQGGYQQERRQRLGSFALCIRRTEPHVGSVSGTGRLRCHDSCNGPSAD